MKLICIDVETREQEVQVQSEEAPRSQTDLSTMWRYDRKRLFSDISFDK